ncbi:MAG: hypothetical protein ACP5QY_02135 [Candidatus Hydrogenedens sp.]
MNKSLLFIGLALLTLTSFGERWIHPAVETPDIGHNPPFVILAMVVWEQ